MSCRVHVVNNTASPAGNMLGHVRSSLKVLSAADIMDVSVILQVQHPDIAALEVSVYYCVEGAGFVWGCSTIPARLCLRQACLCVAPAILCHCAAPMPSNVPMALPQNLFWLCPSLQVTLTAAGTSKDSSTVTLKSPAAGNGGADMIQTIFSDYAPSPFPNGPVSVHTGCLVAECA